MANKKPVKRGTPEQKFLRALRLSRFTDAQIDKLLLDTERLLRQRGHPR